MRVCTYELDELDAGDLCETGHFSLLVFCNTKKKEKNREEHSGKLALVFQNATAAAAVVVEAEMEMGKERGVVLNSHAEWKN